MTKVFQQLDTIEKRIFWGLCATILVLLFMYGYFVNTTVLNIVERKNLEEGLESLRSTFSSLESEYLALTGKIDTEFAKSLGFNETKNVKFVTRTGFAVNLASGINSR